jgi:hypothetical protein
MFTIAGLMYYINWDYQKNKTDEQWHIEFMKKFKHNSQEYECYKIFQETGYSPKYCN